MSDLISRQAAIDALREIEFSHYMEFGEYIGEDTREVRLIRAEKAQDTIEQLPSAQPENCEYCRNLNKTMLLIPQPTQTNTPNSLKALDCVGRQDAIDKVDRIVEVNHLNPDMVWFTPNGVKTLMEDLPSAQPEPNEKYNSMIKELLELEEQTKHFYLTSTERREFQAYVEGRLAI